MGNYIFSNTPTDFFAIFPIFGVIFLNGATDACNSISGVVSSGIWSLKKAAFVCGICNLIGVLVFSILGGRVRDNVFEFGDFGQYSKEAVCACLVGVIIFSSVCWAISLPSSESHALLSCIAGATAALSSKFFMIYVIISVIGYMIFSCVIALIFSFVSVKIFKKSGRECTKSEKIACILSSLMHGAQDGQKLIALIMLLYVGTGEAKPNLVPISICICVGLIMMAGTLAGGRRIVDTLGNELVKTDKEIALASDISASLSILICSLLGFSVSTGNIKACSSVGAGLGVNSQINRSTLKRLILVSLITFPSCIALGYFLTELFILLF